MKEGESGAYRRERLAVTGGARHRLSSACSAAALVGRPRCTARQARLRLARVKQGLLWLQCDRLDQESGHLTVLETESAIQMGAGKAERD